MDFDKVMVVEEGKIVEDSEPKELLKDKDGYFYRLVENTGRESARALREIAEGERRA